MVLVIVTVLGCSANTPKPEKKEAKKQGVVPFEDRNDTARESIKRFKEIQRSKVKGQIPPLVLPTAYEEVSVFDDKPITVSAQNSKLSTLLHSIARISGVNLIIDSDVPADTPITLSVNDAPVEEVLDTLMHISGCYYTLDGNVLHIKQTMRKSFNLPYIHSNSSFSTSLGGDVLNSATSGGTGSSGGGSNMQGIKGDFSLKFENPENNLYKEIENNIKALLSKEGKYTLNRFSGVITVEDRYKNVQAIEKFIDNVKRQVNRQVLIEAKILEVVLNNSHALGVSWEAVSDSIAKAGDQLLLQQGLALTGAVAGTVTYSSDNFNAIINALDTAGDVDTLSNPRIKVLSGQSAIISSGKLVPFWEKEVQTTQGTGGSASNTEVTYNRRDVLDGLSLGVTPTIMGDGNIMLNIIPITSSIEEVIEHYDENGNTVASAPVMNIKEAATVIYAKDNDLVLIGGLINNTKKTLKHQVPWLSSIPGVGALFTNEVIKNEKRELVILIRLRIIQ